MKKIICLFLLAALLLSALCPMLVSCKKDEISGDDSDTVVTVADEEDYNGLEAVDYDGREFNFLTYYEPNNDIIDTKNEIIGDAKGDPVQRGVYERNIIMQEKYNITFNYIETRGNLAPIGEIEKQYMAQTSEIDYILAGALANFGCGVRGYTVAAQDIPHIQLDKDWWYDDFLKETSVAGKNFFIMGDFAYTSWFNSYCLAFNEDLARDWQISPDEVYNLIRNGKWTFDKFKTYCLSVYEDTDRIGDDKPTGGDTFGFYGSGPATDTFLAGANITFLKEMSDGSLKFGYDKNKFPEFYDEVWELYHHKNSLFVDATEWLEDVTLKEAGHAFLESRAVFFACGLPDKNSGFRDVEFKYLYLPTPKWTEEQDKYYSWCHQFNCSSIAIMQGSDLDTLGRIIEDYTFYSMKTVRPAYYETLVEGMMAGSETFIEMLDYIVGIYCIDRASLFATEGVSLLSGKSGDIRKALENGSKPGISVALSGMNSWQKKVDKIVNDMKTQQ